MKAKHKQPHIIIFYLFENFIRVCTVYLDDILSNGAEATEPLTEEQLAIVAGQGGGGLTAGRLSMLLVEGPTPIHPCA